MATKVIGPLGGTYDVGDTANIYELMKQLGGDVRFSVVNKGDAVVYIEWNAATVQANTNERDGKVYLAAGDATLVPGGVTKFCAATASGSAKLLIVHH